MTKQNIGNKTNWAWRVQITRESGGRTDVISAAVRTDGSNINKSIL